MAPLKAISRWWFDWLNRKLPITCTRCGRESVSYEDRKKFVGRWIWISNGFYEGKEAEMYCHGCREYLPEPQGSQEARRRYYSGEPQ